MQKKDYKGRCKKKHYLKVKTYVEHIIRYSLHMQIFYRQMIVLKKFAAMYSWMD